VQGYAKIALAPVIIYSYCHVAQKWSSEVMFVEVREIIEVLLDLGKKETNGATSTV
jgi:hypothetical protein